MRREAEPGPGGSPRRWAAAGLAGSSTATVAAALVHTAFPSVPFPPLSIAQAIVRAAPGGFATTFIDLLGHWALRLAVAGTMAAFLASGAVLGVVMGMVVGRVPGGRYGAAVLVFLPLWAVIVLLSPSDPQFVGRGMLAVAMAPVWLAAALVAARTSVSLRADPAERPGVAVPPPVPGISRRVVLRSLWWGALGALLGVADLGKLLRPRPNPGRLPIHLADVTPAVLPSSSPADRSFDRIAGLTPEVTSNEGFYVVDEEIIDPDIDPATWTLTIGGLVRRPVRLSYRELLSFPAVERYQTLECISNRVGGDLISTAKWVGVPLPLVLERAGVRSGAVEVVFRAAGGYSDSISVAQAMDESTLIAVGMNGRVLPREHGFPARVLSVGTYGMKNPKWLTGIEVMDSPYRGYWEQRGWSKRAIVKTGSRIDVPRDGSSVSGPTTVAGVAFAGDRGISRVEVSTDGGGTWRAGELKRPLSPLTWRLWRFDWTPPDGSGRNGILARAYDGRGVAQIHIPADPHPDGASGYDGLTIVRATGSG